VVRQLLFEEHAMRRSLSVLMLGAALLGGACGSVESLGGTGGTGGGTHSVPATGGVPGTGGLPGTGGIAGAPGTGGGGAGHAGGGHGGAAGHGGAGGYGGVGGHGGGHVGGAGGPGGAGGQGGGQHADAGQTCDEIKAAFDQALVAAMSCTLGAQNQCQAMALIAPLGSCPGCAQYVNDATTLDALRSQWSAQQCSQPMPCPAIACALPRAVTCAAGDGSAGATCQAVAALAF
jgi:hypothetical protein